MSNACAYFLIAHGSRDLSARQGLEACATFVSTLLAENPLPSLEPPPVGTGVLEFGQPLAVQIAAFAQTVAGKGIRRIFLLPLFLVSGNHVNQDLPEALHQAQSQLPDISLTLCPFLGSHPNISLLVQERMGEVLPCDRWILLAHGTRRPGGNSAINTLATQLGAVPAYWATAPSLADQLQALTGLSAQRVGILPYFLFTGRTIDAIHQHVLELRPRFPRLELQLTQPLNPSPLLAKLLIDRCISVSFAP